MLYPWSVNQLAKLFAISNSLSLSLSKAVLVSLLLWQAFVLHLVDYDPLFS
jgi:hypothetical protein